MEGETTKGRVASERLVIAAAERIKERDYWLDKLAGIPLATGFPPDLERTGGARRGMDSETFEVHGELFSGLMKLANHSDTRLHMILLAALVVMLNRYTGKTDILLGSPIYRQDVDSRFINTVLVLRNILEGGMTFKDLLLQVRQTVMEAAEHYAYPLKVLIEQLNLPPGDDGFPLFDVLVLLRNIHDEQDVRDIRPHMVFSFCRESHCLVCLLKTNSSLYEKAAVKNIIRHFNFLLSSLLADVDARVEDISLLSAEEKRLILSDFNNTAAAYPRQRTIHEWFESRVEKTPAHTALAAGDHFLTYRELNKRANQLARLLRQTGVKPGGVVGLLIERSPEMISGILGILKSGAAYLPIDPQYPAGRVYDILEESELPVLFTTGGASAHLSHSELQRTGSLEISPVKTAPRQQITDLDSLPIVDRTLIDYEKYHRYIGIALAKNTVHIQATRGCPYHCAYCHKIWPKRHAARSFEHIFREIEICYQSGVRRFVFIDDIFNLRRENASRLMEKIIRQGLDIQMFFANGLRGDILTRDLIDLLIEAGTVDIVLALESASPRLQALMGKNLDLARLSENLDYIIDHYPRVITEIEMMIGFPTESEEEALLTLNFLENRGWIHFPNLHILKIYPHTDMYDLAVKNGVPAEFIKRSTRLAFHQLPETLPFKKSFVQMVQARFLNEYFLSKDRLLEVLPAQMNILTPDELVQKYNSYLPMEIKSIDDILQVAGISRQELGQVELLDDDYMAAPGFSRQAARFFPPAEKDDDAFRVLLLDLSQLFSNRSKALMYDVAEEPLGLMFLMTYLDRELGPKVAGKVAKSRIDFDSFGELETLFREFGPELVGIRTLSLYRDFFHQTVSLIRQWGFDMPIVAGGPYATSDYTLLLQDANVDLVVLGEGELTFAELVEKMLENNKKLPAEEVLRRIRGIGFIAEEDQSRLRESGCRVLCPELLAEAQDRQPVENLENLNRAADLLYLISTSGSSGRPRLVMLEHRNLANLLNFQFQHTRIDFSGPVLQFASIGFDVSAQEIFSSLLGGGRLCLIRQQDRGDIGRLFDIMKLNGIRTVFFPPSFLRFIFLEGEYMGGFPTSVRHIVCAGERLVVPEPLRNHLKEHEVYLHNHYGPSETHVVTALTIHPDTGIPENPTIGKPIANTGIYVLDENRQLLPVGPVGEIYISGDSVGRGYYGREDLTGERFFDDPFNPGQRMYRSGDLARWRPDGELAFMGRADTQVKVRGFRVEPGEIENHLLACGDVKDAVVVDREDLTGERYLCAYIVPAAAPGTPRPEVSALKERLAARLPDYMVPAFFVTLERIPLTANGKVDRKRLPPPVKGRVKAFVPPRDDIEERLALMWSKILAIEKSHIGLDDNFFELGGHSLKATILIAKIHRQFNVRPTLGDMFEQPTIRGLSRLIRGAAVDRYVSIPAAEEREFYALSAAQERLFFLHRLEPGSTGYNISTAVRLTGVAEPARVERMFARLIRRHEILRTAFVLVEERPVQKILAEVEFAVGYSVCGGEASAVIDDFVRPFDLARPPLLRVELVRLADREHLLMMDMHHIAADGFSMGIIVRELSHLYDGRALPGLRVQYRDFSQWQQGRFRSGELKGQEDYWLARFSGPIPVLDLPVDFSRSAVQSFAAFAGDRVAVEIGDRLGARLRSAASRAGVTLYILLLSALNILLSKYSLQPDIVVGSPVTGRRHADLQNVVGLFVNMLALRNEPAEGKSFGEFLEEVRSNTLQAFENQDYPFDKLVGRLGVRRELGRNPLFDVVFNMAEGGIPAQEPGTGGGLRVKPPGIEIKTAKYDLLFRAAEGSGSITLSIEYSTELFKRATIQNLAGHYVEILEQVTEDRDIVLSEITVSHDLLLPESGPIREDGGDFLF